MRVDNYEFGIFDLDGTLLDSKGLARRILLAVLMFLTPNFTKNRGSYYSTNRGIFIPEWFLPFYRFSFIAHLISKGEDTIIKFCELCERNGKVEPRVYDGTKEILCQLREKGIKLFVTTSGNEGTAINYLQKTGLLDFFSSVKGSDKMPRRDHIPYFSWSVGLSREEFAKRSFLVDDCSMGLVFAAQYHIHSIGVTNTIGPNLLQKFGAEEVISNMWELLK